MSKYNKNLPKPSEICWISANRKNRETTITMPFKGTIPSDISYIGWRQSSYAYSYQVQYKVTARMVPSKQLETGADTTKTIWKYPNPSWSGDVNTFNKCVAQDKKNRYYRYYSFAGKSLMTKGSYDKLTVTVRVRSFNKTKKQHGAWVSKNLSIKCKPNIEIYKIVALADGGIQIYLNTNGWMRGDSKVILKSIRHASVDAQENKKELTDEVGAIGGEEAKDYPYAEFKGSDFNTDFRENEQIVLKNCVFRTCDGVDVSLDGTYTIDTVSAVIDAPVMEITRNEDAGLISVKISKGDASDDWDNVYAWINCIVHGKTKRYDYSKMSGSGDSIRYFYFRPPLDCAINLCVGITNNLGGKFTKTYTESNYSGLAKIPSKERVMINYTDGTDEQPANGVFNGSRVASMNYEVDYSIDAQRHYEKEMPFGRRRPVAFLGEGLEKTINIKGSIDGTENDDYKTVPYSSYYDWLDLQEQQGIVLVRMPFGRTFTALCTKLIISQEDEFDETRNIDLSVDEVEI